MSLLTFNLQGRSPYDRKLFIGKGGLLPRIDIRILDGRDPFCFAPGSTVTFSMIDRQDADKIRDVAGVIVDREDGLISYEWTGTDTDTPGEFFGQFKLTLTGDPAETSFQTGTTLDELLIANWGINTGTYVLSTGSVDFDTSIFLSGTSGGPKIIINEGLNPTPATSSLTKKYASFNRQIDRWFVDNSIALIDAADTGLKDCDGRFIWSLDLTSSTGNISTSTMENASQEFDMKMLDGPPVGGSAGGDMLIPNNEDQKLIITVGTAV